jgi:hypothetical protein
MTYLDEHIRDIVVNEAKSALIQYVCIKDYTMDDGTLAYKKGESYTTDGELDDEGFFVMPSLFDDTHRMDTSGDFYEHFTRWDITSTNHIPIFDNPFYAGKDNPLNAPTKDSVVNSVIESFIERSNVGFNKYGTNLDRKDLSLLDWISHAQQEAMDMILYLEKIKKQYNEQKNS